VNSPKLIYASYKSNLTRALADDYGRGEKGVWEGTNGPLDIIVGPDVFNFVRGPSMAHHEKLKPGKLAEYDRRVRRNERL
jgi:hypothetical protein